jgi:hypothetical protein
MVSKKAAQQLADVLMEFIPSEQMDEFLKQLSEVEGNKSYRDTIQAVKELLK